MISTAEDVMSVRSQSQRSVSASVRHGAPGPQVPQQSPQVAEALKMAERLFETSTVVELREVPLVQHLLVHHL